MAKTKTEGECPTAPEGTLTIEGARLLPGLIGMGDMTIRRTLKAAELSRKWPEEGRGRWKLWDAAKAGELAARRLQPKDRPSPCQVEEPERSSASRDVPDGWSTTWELQESLAPYGRGDPSVRQVRRVLLRNVVGPPLPDAVDERICDAFDRLFDKAGVRRLARKLPSKLRLVEMTDRYGRTLPKIQRVYPHGEALDWFETARDSDEDERMERQMLVGSYASAVAAKGLVLNVDRYTGRRNPWCPFVAALLGEANSLHAEGQGLVIQLFIAKRKEHWRAEQADARVIADELAVQLDRLRSV